MKGPFVRTGLALAVLAGLGAYIYFVESKKPSGSEKKKEKVLELSKDKVTALDIEPPSGEAVHLVKQGKDWKLGGPAAAPADANEVDSLLSTLQNLEVEEVVNEKPASLGEFGLDPPRRSLSATLAGAKQPLKLLLGDKTPDGGALYAKTPDKPRVFTIASYQEASLSKKPFDLRDRDLLHVKRDAVRTLEITGPDGSYALLRDDKGEWTFTRPLTTRAGRWAVDGLLGTLESLRMDSIAAEDAKDLKPFGLVKPARTLSLGLADGATKRLEIGSSAADKKYHAREASSSLVAVIPGAIVDDLAKGMKELRQKRLADIPTYEVTGVDATLEGKAFVYARSTTQAKQGVQEEKWKRTSPDKKDVDRSKVEDVLFKLSGVEVQDFVDKPQAAASYGLDQPFAKLSFRFEAGKPAVELTLGRKDGATYAKRPGDDAVLKLDSAKVDEALKALKEL